MTEGEQVNVVVLDPVRNGQPEYCTHGYAECLVCRRLCWLGYETSKVVTSGLAHPVCIECVGAVLPFGAEPFAHVEDGLHDHQ